MLKFDSLRNEIRNLPYEERIENAIRLLDIGVHSETVADYTNLPENEISKLKMLIEARDKALHDEATLVSEARMEGKKCGISKGKAEEKIEIAKKALAMGLDISNIIKLTGLSKEEIEGLKS